jgi:non-ribosomal peptide synthase protein (TIGR01720 family)
VGWFTSVYPVVLQAPPFSTTADVIKAVKEQYRRIPRNGIGYAVLKDIARYSDIARLDSESRDRRIQFNYLGRFDNTRGLEDASGFVLSEEFAGNAIDARNRDDVPISINGLVHDQRLRLAITFAAHRFTAAEMKAFHSSFIAALRDVRERCELVNQKAALTRDQAMLTSDSQTLLAEGVEI